MPELNAWNVHCGDLDMLIYSETCMHIKEALDVDLVMEGLQLDHVKIFFPYAVDVEELDP